jgi:hypothetical protein
MNENKPKQGRRLKRAAPVPVETKTYFQQVGAPTLPIEDFYPGCVCAIGQHLPGDIDVEKVLKAASLGMRNKQIAALVGVREDTLINHFRKTIASARAEHAMKLLGMVNERAEDLDSGKKFDFQALSYLLDRQDPEPEKAPQTIFVAPLPRDIIEMPSVEMTKEIRQLKHEKGVH